MIGAQIPKKKLINTNNTKLNGQSSFLDNQNFEEIDVLEEDEEIIDALHKIFRIDGEALVFQTSNYKEKSKLEREIRMSLLILLGYKHLHNSSEIKRNTLTEILKKSKLGTSNFRRWISKCNEIVQLKGGIISLTPTGTTSAIAVLTEILDSNITNGSIEFSKPSSTQRKNKTSNNEGSTSTNRNSKNPKACLEKLIGEGFFTQKRTLSDIIIHLKNDHAVTLKSTDISGHMSKYINKKLLKREKGNSGYEYFI